MFLVKMKIKRFNVAAIFNPGSQKNFILELLTDRLILDAKAHPALNPLGRSHIMYRVDSHKIVLVQVHELFPFY